MELWSGNAQAGIAHHEEELAICRELGDLPAEGHAMNCLGAIAMEASDYRRAEGVFKDALGIFEDLHESYGGLFVAPNPARLWLRRGEFETARRYAERTIALCRATQHTRTMGGMQIVLGQLCRATHESAAARSHYRLALQIAQQVQACADTELVLYDLGLLDL